MGRWIMHPYMVLENTLTQDYVGTVSHGYFAGPKSPFFRTACGAGRAPGSCAGCPRARTARAPGWRPPPAACPRPPPACSCAAGPAEQPGITRRVTDASRRHNLRISRASGCLTPATCSLHELQAWPMMQMTCTQQHGNLLEHLASAGHTRPQLPPMRAQTAYFTQQGQPKCWVTRIDPKTLQNEG